MNTARTPAPAGAPLRINVEGPPETVARLVAAMARALAGDEEAAAPALDPLYLSVPELARRTGISGDRLRGLVKRGRLRNYGTETRILLAPAEVRRALEE